MSANGAYSLVATAPSPASSGTTVTVTAGTGSRFFAGKAFVWPASTVPSKANLEVVTISSVSTDTLTIVRAQESSAARTVVVGDQIAQGITAGMWDALSTTYAPLASPALTGTPTVPTAAPGTNTTQAGSTAFVAAAVALKAPLPSGTPTVGQVPVVTTASPLALDWGAVGGAGIKRTYGAAGDMLVVTDATVSGSTVTSPSGLFTSAHVGKVIAIQGAGADNGTLVVRAVHKTTIAGFTSSTQVTLTAAVTNAVAGPRTVTDAAITAGSTTLNSTSASFTQADVGKFVSVPGAARTTTGGAHDTALRTRIVRITSGTAAVVDAPAGVTVSAKTVVIPGAWVGWGTDDTAAFNAAAAVGGSIEIEAGRYLTTDQVGHPLKSNTEWWGRGPGVSIVSPVGTFGAAFESTNASAQLTDITFRDFEIDGSGVRVSTYNTLYKGLYLTDVKRLKVLRMFVHDTAATAIGCDFLPESLIADNVVERGGAQVYEFNAGSGGAGIGIGSGAYLVEDVVIRGNSAKVCGAKGIFTESQSTTLQSQGIRIIGNHAEDCGGAGQSVGIGDFGNDGAIIQANTTVGCVIAAWNAFGSSIYSINAMILDNVVYASNILAVLKSGDVTIRGNQVVGVSGTAGIDVQVVAGGTLGTCLVEDNFCKDSAGIARGIWLESGTWDHVIVQRNKVRNVGTSGSKRPAIASGVTATAMYVRDNVTWDNRGASAGISFGLQLTGGTLTRFVYEGNDFLNSGTAADDLTGATITAQVTHFNP